MQYTFGRRVEIKPSALKWGVSESEIAAVVAYPMLRVTLAARMAGALPVLHIGPASENEPYLEVIVDLAPTVPVAFHAMVLRRRLATSLGLDQLIDINYGPQKGAQNA